MREFASWIFGMIFGAMLRALPPYSPPFGWKANATHLVNSLLLKIFRVPPTGNVQLKAGGQYELDLRSKNEVIPYYLRELEQGTEAELLAQLLKILEPGWTVLDIGAGIGFNAIPLALRLQELQGAGQVTGRVVAFEPVPSYSARLEQNARLNHLESVVQVERLALSHRPSRLRMEARLDRSDHLSITDAVGVKTTQLEIQTARLDDLVRGQKLRRVDLIKLDVDFMRGHEPEFLQGAHDVIAAFRPMIVGNFVERDPVCQKIFQELNYVFYKSPKPTPKSEIFVIPAEKAKRVRAVLS